LIVPLKKQKKPDFVPRRPIANEHFFEKGNRHGCGIVCPAETPQENYSMSTPKKPKNEPLDIRDEDVARFETDSELKSKDGEIYPDETMSLRARRQAARQHEDAFIVATDLEDDDQRDAAPGTREQP
jgi:Na+-translocating ferredoxin:NAD+ oxidoreductase RnfC subunit